MLELGFSIICLDLFKTLWPDVFGIQEKYEILVNLLDCKVAKTVLRVARCF